MSRVCAIDWGEKRVGIALSAPGNTYSLPFRVFPNDQYLFKAIRETCVANDVSILVIGLPLMLDGKDTFISKKIRFFGEKLETWLLSNCENPPTVRYFNERHTTDEAESLITSVRRLRKKEKTIKDALAASILLDTFLAMENKPE